jgi:hypothetical protein
VYCDCRKIALHCTKGYETELIDLNLKGDGGFKLSLVKTVRHNKFHHKLLWLDMFMLLCKGYVRVDVLVMCVWVLWNVLVFIVCFLLLILYVFVVVIV